MAVWSTSGHGSGQARDPRVGRELGGVARCWRLGAVPHVWHDDGLMMATWFQGPADDFIRVSREGWERGVSDPALPRWLLDRPRRRPRDRADEDDDLAARRRCTTSLCDVVCTGRFYDFLERRDGRWGIVLRQPIYEKDRLDPVDPAARCPRPSAARAFPRLSPSRLPADAARLRREARHARPHRPGGRRAVRARIGLALRARRGLKLSTQLSTHWGDLGNRG